MSDFPQDFSTRFDFSDRDRNLAFVTLKSLDGNDTAQDRQTLPVEGVDTLTTGTPVGQVMPSTVRPDNYTARIYVKDATETCHRGGA